MAKQCTKAFAWNGRQVVAAGTVLPDKHPAVKHNPDAFVDVEGLVERATASPGEKRKK